MQRKILTGKEVFAQAFKELEAEGFYDELAKALKLKPKRAYRARALTRGKKPPVKKPSAVIKGKKTRERARAASGSIRLSARAIQR